MICVDRECCGQEILNSICRIYVAEISAAICNNEMLFCQKREIAAAGIRGTLLAFTKMVSCLSGSEPKFEGIEASILQNAWIHPGFIGVIRPGL